MKILHVFPFYSISGGGGTTWLIDQLSIAQSKAGHEVTVITTDYMFDQNNLNNKNNYNVVALKSYFNFFGIYFSPELFRFCNKSLRDYDIIHLHLFRSIQNSIICYYANKFKIPYVIDAHGSLPRHFKVKYLKKYFFDILLGKDILKNSKAFIAENELSYKEYIDYGVDDDKIAIVRPPFPVKEYVDLPRKGLFKSKHNLEKKSIILFFGRIHWIKGIDILVKSFNLIQLRRDDIHLVIMGEDDGFKAKVVEIIKNLKITHKVLFTGYLSGNEKLSCIIDSSVVVQTSRYEQGAGAPLEAVLCNVPIIVSDNSGAAMDVKRLNAGYIVNFNDHEQLSDTIEYVVDNQDEAVIKTKFGAERIRQDLSIEKNIIEYDKVYKSCID
tara:strand:+ start:659 stop:1807 length:1149 start_codon:yes stop_codon:yes gene_type:complete